MINLKDARITQTVPAYVSRQAEVKAFSQAFGALTKILLALEKETDIYASSEAMSDSVCDLLGAEWRVPQYSQSLPLSTKRALIKEALMLFSNAGTASAVETLIETIFGSAELQEWFQYGGDAGYYMVTTDNPSVGEDELGAFKAAAQSVKRLSAWLDSVEIGLKVESMNISTAVFLREYEKVTMKIDTD